MENPKRAQVRKLQIRPRRSTYVEPRSVSQGLEQVREAAGRDLGTPLFHPTLSRYLPEVGAG